MDEKIIELEKKAAFQEDLLVKLNDALVSQQKQLTALQARVQALQDFISRGDLVKRQEDETPPPHY